MSNSIKTAIILAGGLGTRLRTLVNDRPKPMAPIKERPFLQYLLKYWEMQGISRFIISVGYLHEKITSYFGSKFNSSSIEYVIEDVPLGTGGGLLNCIREKNIKSPFLLLNGDTYFKVDLGLMQHLFFTTQADWCLSLFSTNEEKRYLLIDVDVNKKIKFLNEKVKLSNKKCWANGGVYIINPKVLNKFKKNNIKVSLEDNIIPESFKAGDNFIGFKSLNSFIDIGLPKDYERIINNEFKL